MRRNPSGSPTHIESPPGRVRSAREAGLGCRRSIFGRFWWNFLDITPCALPKPERFPSPPESLCVVLGRGSSGQTSGPRIRL